MRRQRLHEPFSIQLQKLAPEGWDSGKEEGHQHSFFELVYILDGTGVQCINQGQFAYQPGHMFLITPEDCHSFTVGTTTDFFFLQFNNIYLPGGGLLAQNVRNLEYILKNATHRPGCLLKNPGDKAFVRQLIDAMVQERTKADLFNRELVVNLINALILVVARNIAKYQGVEVEEETVDEKAMEILQYLQANIYDPEKLRAEHVGEMFGLSAAYVGRFFKQHIQETMVDYVTSYRMKLIEHRLEFSEKRINEIAAEFNFSDESHFTKFFKKERGVTPKAYREKLRNVVSQEAESMR